MAKRSLKVGKMQCPDCLAVVPSEARACRHCGHRFSSEQLQEQTAFEARMQKFQPIGVIVLVALVIFLVARCSSAPNSTTPPAETAQTTELWAKATATAAVKQRMKNPGSFELVGAEAMPVKTGDNKPGWAVGITYRGTNSSGGVTTENAMVSVDETGRVPLEVIDIKLKSKRRR